MTDLYETDFTLAVALEQMEQQRMLKTDRVAILVRYFGLPSPTPVETHGERLDMYERLFASVQVGEQGELPI